MPPMLQQHCMREAIQPSAPLKKDVMHARLTIRIAYDDAHAPQVAAISAQLRAAATHLAERGHLTGENPSLLVDEWRATVEVGDV